MKRLGKALGFGVCVGVLAALVQTKLHLDRELFLRGYMILLLLILAGAIGFQIAYQMYYQKKMRALIAQRSEGDVNGYITGMEALLERAKGKNVQNLLRINLSAGYFDTEEYDKAVALLEEVDETKEAGALVRTVYRHNLCMNYFYAGQGEKGLKLFEESKKQFDRYRNMKQTGGALEAVYILAALQRGRFDQAKELLERAKSTWSEPRVQQTFQRLETHLKEAQIRAEKTP